MNFYNLKEIQELIDRTGSSHDRVLVSLFLLESKFRELATVMDQLREFKESIIQEGGAKNLLSEDGTGDN